MARLRKFVCYRKLERPYTRKSKYTRKSFVRVVPASRIQRYQTGNAQRKFAYKVLVVAKEAVQIRHNALESARQTSNKVLDRKLTRQNYFLKLRVYPHHILRENALASGAGADRLSTGMQHSFGKSIAVSAQLRPGQPIFEINVDKEGLDTARIAGQRIKHKVPCGITIEVVKAQLKTA